MLLNQSWRYNPCVHTLSRNFDDRSSENQVPVQQPLQGDWLDPDEGEPGEGGGLVHIHRCTGRAQPARPLPELVLLSETSPAAAHSESRLPMSPTTSTDHRAAALAAWFAPRPFQWQLYHLPTQNFPQATETLADI